MATRKTPATSRKSPAPATEDAGQPERVMFPLRLSQATLDGVDAWVAELNSDPARIGGKVARSHLLERIITEAVRERAARGEP